MELSLLRLWVLVQSLALELSHAMGAANQFEKKEKERKKKKKKKRQVAVAGYIVTQIFSFAK